MLGGLAGGDGLGEMVGAATSAWKQPKDFTPAIVQKNFLRLQFNARLQGNYLSSGNESILQERLEYGHFLNKSTWLWSG
ncbi:MAG: hypothetical protein ACKOJF_08600, partial [Planctomycetaceae bacterium]